MSTVVAKDYTSDNIVIRDNRKGDMSIYKYLQLEFQPCIQTLQDDEFDFQLSYINN